MGQFKSPAREAPRIVPTIPVLGLTHRKPSPANSVTNQSLASRKPNRDSSRTALNKTSKDLVVKTALKSVKQPGTALLSNSRKQDTSLARQSPAKVIIPAKKQMIPRPTTFNKTLLPRNTSMKRIVPFKIG